VTAFRDGLRADLATRRSGDGRQPVDNCTEFFDMGVHQVRAANGASSAPTFGPTRPTPAVLEADELTVLTSWAEAIAEVLAYVPARAQTVLADALPGALRGAPLSESRSPHGRSAGPSTRCRHLFDPPSPQPMNRH
jgi:hypothetical protein